MSCFCLLREYFVIKNNQSLSINVFKSMASFRNGFCCIIKIINLFVVKRLFCQFPKDFSSYFSSYIIFMHLVQQWRLPLAGRVFRIYKFIFHIILAPEFVLFTFELTLSLTMNCEPFVSINLFKISFGFTAIYLYSFTQLFAKLRELFKAMFPLVLLCVMLEL